MTLRGPLVESLEDAARQLATMEELIHRLDGGSTVTAACGVDGLKVIGLGDCGIIPWPVSTRTLAPWRRCPECWEATGRKRPRARIKKLPSERADNGRER